MKKSIKGKSPSLPSGESTGKSPSLPLVPCIRRILPVLCLLLLLARPALAFSGAKNGLVLWGTVVLPTLLPFMICSGVIVALDGVGILIKPFAPFFRGLLKLSKNGCFVLVSGLLCGYPMGAKTDSEFLNSRRISLKQARYLLAISNHPSPMFVLGYVMDRIGLVPAVVCPIWIMAAALYLPVVPVAWLAQKVYGYHGEEDLQQQSGAARIKEKEVYAPFSFDAHMMGCFETMVKIGGYIMLFSILAMYLTAMPFENPLLRCALLGTVEITTGIQSIAQGVPGFAAVLMITASTAFGGLSGIFQTKSVLKNAGLSIRHYCLWKLVHSVFSCILLAALWYLFTAAQGPVPPAAPVLRFY